MGRLRIADVVESMTLVAPPSPLHRSPMSTAATPEKLPARVASPPLIARLIALIRRKPITAADRREAAMFVLDTVASAVGGRSTPPGQAVGRWAHRQGGSLDAARRAFVVGCISHVLEMDDLHRASVTHPGCVVVPAVLALGQREGARGHALLDAVLHGYEACCRVGMAVGPAHYRIFHNTATCGPFGSAMAAAHLLGLDDAQTGHALGNAGTQAAGFWEFLKTGAMSKHLHAGRAAEAGMVAADLALDGFTGPPAILEGACGLFAGMCPDAAPDALLADPDAPWQLHQTSIKPWPSCRHTHPAIDAALALHAALAGGPPVAAVEVETYRAAIDVCDRPDPATEYNAKFSLQHCVAAALADGVVRFASFDPDSRQRLAAARAKVAVAAGEPFASAYPAAWGARVIVRTADGRQHVVERAACSGDPDRKLPESRLLEKADELFRLGGLTPAEATAMRDHILRLADDQPLDASLLGTLLSGAREQA